MTKEEEVPDNENDADFKKGAWTPEEDALLSQLIEVGCFCELRYTLLSHATCTCF